MAIAQPSAGERDRRRTVAVALTGIFVAAMWLAGCSSSLVLLDQTPDPTFVRAQERLSRTGRLVDAAKASEPERATFMQAEAFYEYRFTFPRRGVLNYLAEGAAAVADLPALQSLAGSLDLADLRLRAYDGAAHLWEALLYRYPSSPLRPLTLYRLGWAYRSTGVEGLPHRSGDALFDQLIAENPGTPLATLAVDAKKTRWKSKSKATAWSLIPGAGQFYVGAYGSGAARLLIALASAAMVVTPIAVAIDRRNELGWDHDWPLLVTGTVGVVILSLDYTSSYQDAIRRVVHFNDRAEAVFQEAHPDAP